MLIYPPAEFRRELPGSPTEAKLILHGPLAPPLCRACKLVGRR